MKFAKNILIFLLLIIAFQSGKAQYIQIDDNQTAQELIENVLINSSCANVSNITVSGWAFTNGNSYGYFNRGTSTFPFQDGVIIATGRALSAIGPNSSLLSEGPTNWLGDIDLQQAINETNTINATVIEFDFLPFANKVSFDYIFSSEQYLSNPNSNQCSYSDGFAFLLKEVGSQDQYTNLAVVPGTAIPVKVPTVRGTGTICPPANEAYFDAFNGIEHPTNYNGQTKILKAESLVTPGVLYHIKLVIADQGNNLYDSAIFLGGGSFTVETELGDDRLIANGNPLCENETLTLDATSPNAVGYKWYRNNVLINNETNQTYTVNSFGFYKVEVVFNTTCSSFGEIVIEYSSNPIPNDVYLTQCDSDTDGLAIFNLNDANSSVIGSNLNVGPPKYFLNFNDAFTVQNTLTSIDSFQNTTPNQIIYARLENTFGCFGISEVTLSTSISAISVPPIFKCDGDTNQDGITVLDLSMDISPTVLSYFPSGLQAVYYSSTENAQTQTNALPNNYTNIIPFEELIFARITDGVNCFGILPITLKINIFIPNNFETEELSLCENETYFLEVEDIYESYLWNTGEITPRIDISAPDTYTVTVTNTDGCEATKIFIISPSGVATITSIDVQDFSGNQNTVQINYTGLGDYLFSLDGNYFQNSPIFTNVEPGEYLVIVKDTNGCGIVTQQIFVLDYPRFFTPNGDGFNDFWEIKNFNQPNSKIYIFNRYGKLIKEILPNQKGWDGTFSGSPLPSSDFWFSLFLENGRIIKGHFALKR
ncbi:choice-of-anchor L domain-containing protein [Flavobacterium sp.]|jgi:gliding motility-associated-like protein|uniref:choice-of-anchor L domain-containing protein n=1 Tax=Flavobacterium sp. TaxID=239 RepID=UPI0037BF0E36